MEALAFAESFAVTKIRSTPTLRSSFLPSHFPQLPRARSSPSPPKRRRATTSAVIEALNSLSITADLAKPIASGAFGEVFYGTLKDTGEPVVLKRAYADTTARKLFKTERAINQKIDDGPDATPRHWPKFLGNYVRNSQTFLVWRKEGEGATLASYLNGRPTSDLCAALRIACAPTPLNLPLFRAVVASLLRAQAELHERGVVHRDVKPANILVAPGVASGDPLKLIDFGSSCDVQNVFWSRGLNTLDPLYGAPERRLSVLAPEKFDVFSVGLIGVSVLMPTFAGESRLREFKSRLEAADFDLRRYRDEVRANGGAGVSGSCMELEALFEHTDERAVQAFELLCAMLKKSPQARSSVKSALLSLGMA